jgi:hypothetical protein
MPEENDTKRDEGLSARTGDVDAATGQPIEDAEKNLSRHTTTDSSPPIEEQWRTSVQADDELVTSSGKLKNREQGGE